MKEFLINKAHLCDGSSALMLKVMYAREILYMARTKQYRVFVSDLNLDHFRNHEDFTGDN